MGKISAGKLLDIVQDVSQPWWRYIPLTFLIAFVPSTFISLILGFVTPPESAVRFGELSVGLVISLVAIAPLVETLIMWPVLALIQRFVSKKPIITAAISALLWAVFHSLQTPIWGLTICWSFFVFSLCFLSWKKVSIIKAGIMTFAVHVMQNSLAVGYMLLRG